VHELLVASDRMSAGENGIAPQRNPASSERAVANDWVWVLHDEGDLISMVTVSPEWSGPDERLAHFPPTPEPRYMRRLAVAPDRHGTGSLLSLRTIKQALQVASDEGATMLRCETNPHDASAVRVLQALGFTRVGPEFGEAPTSSVLLYREL